jgi:signal transduction histidine kinase/HAMP domain-containing protein
MLMEGARETVSRIREPARIRAPRARVGVRLWLGVAFAAVGVLTAASVYLFVADSSDKAISDRSGELAVGRVVRVADQIGAVPGRQTGAVLRKGSGPSFGAWAFDQRGRLVAGSPSEGLPLETVQGRETAVGEALDGGRYVKDLPDDVTVVAVPVFRDGRIDGAVLARATPPRPLERASETLRGDSLLALGIAVGIGVLVGFGVSSAIANRVKRLAGSARRIAGGELDQPVEAGGRDEIGELAQALESMRAELRESFNALSTERDKLSTIFESLDEAVLVVGEGGDVRFTNPAGERLIAADGRPLPQLDWVLRRAAQRGSAEQDMIRDGNRVYAAAVRQVPAERAVLAVVRDRTEELRRQEAEREFVSNAAHELRNPLAGISGAIEVLRSGAKDDPEAREHFLARLADDAERMSRLTQSLLALAAAEAIEHAEAEVVDVAVAAQEAVDVLARPEGIDFEMDVEDDLSAGGDPVLLRQVLIGLLSNAFKHTPAPGRVSLRARREGRSFVTIEVTDTGPGIASKEQRRIFERFYRGSGSLEREGFGLGLSIAKRMVDVMHGTIAVDSTPGEGSTFRIRLPVAKPTRTPVA